MKGFAALTSSKTDNWATPQALFNSLHGEFDFTLDPCADSENAKCPVYFDRERDGLAQNWTGRVFMNPPYGKDISKWVQKAFESVACGACELVVCLLPARTDTRWWHEYCIRGEVRFIKGRLKFGDSKNPATFPSVVVVFRGGTR